ncbi:uncharacterized protein LOC106998315 isoform X2 [Macaca mulatta]
MKLTDVESLWSVDFTSGIFYNAAVHDVDATCVLLGEATSDTVFSGTCLLPRSPQQHGHTFDGLRAPKRKHSDVLRLGPGLTWYPLHHPLCTRASPGPAGASADSSQHLLHSVSSAPPFGTTSPIRPKFTHPPCSAGHHSSPSRVLILAVAICLQSLLCKTSVGPGACLL